jgi:hypothetical protein
VGKRDLKIAVDSFVNDPGTRQAERLSGECGRASYLTYSTAAAGI